MHRVVALAIADVVAFDLAIPGQVFGHRDERDRYSFAVCAARAGAVRSTTGYDVQAVAGLEALDTADTIVVPGFWPLTRAARTARSPPNPDLPLPNGTTGPSGRHLELTRPQSYPGQDVHPRSARRRAPSGLGPTMLGRFGRLRPWAVPLPVLALGVVLVVGVVLEAVHEIRVHPGASPAGPFFDDWLHDFLILTSAGVCAAGATRHTRDARAWTLMAIALLCIGMGEITWDLLYTHVDAASIPYPSLADAFDLASYPLFLAGLILIVRRRVPIIELHRWLDGIVIVLVVIAPMVALVLDPVLRQAPPDLIGQIVTLAYPFGDLVLLGTLLGALPMMSWRIDASWLPCSA